MEKYIKNNINNTYLCTTCDYVCFDKNNMTRHYTSNKHKKNTSSVIFTQKSISITTTEKKHICTCGKKYATRSGFWKHSKVCNFNTPNTQINICNVEKTTHLSPDIICKLVDQNSELHKIIIEQNKKMIELNNKPSNTFNLQFFLNETCKHALNFTDFINQIHITVNDLEETGKIGYSEGISKLFIRSLKNIELNKRPIHCCDSKREIVYIKEHNKWEKDDISKTCLTNAIKTVTNKNIKTITQWQKEHPSYSNPNTKDNDIYMNIIYNSFSGSTTEESYKNYEKIVKNVVKEVTISKI
jgi:hypothetical protein